MVSWCWHNQHHQSISGKKSIAKHCQNTKSYKWKKFLIDLEKSDNNRANQMKEKKNWQIFYWMIFKKRIVLNSFVWDESPFYPKVLCLASITEQWIGYFRGGIKTCTFLSQLFMPIQMNGAMILLFNCYSLFQHLLKLPTINGCSILWK